MWIQCQDGSIANMDHVHHINAWQEFTSEESGYTYWRPINLEIDVKSEIRFAQIGHNHVYKTGLTTAEALAEMRKLWAMLKDEKR